MKMKKSLLIISAGVVLGVSGAYAAFGDKKEAVEFYSGHYHDNGQTIGAPGHSGGTDKFGCHNRSVPYHCH